jgi:transcriptional regulator with XRE-family HTH domain
MHPFSELLHELIRAHGGTKQSFAQAIRITPSTLSHFLAGRVSHPPSTELCLRIAEVSGMSASKVLTAAGKADIAARIEALYGLPRIRRPLDFVSAHELAHLTLWRQLGEGREERALALLLKRTIAAMHRPVASPIPFRRPAKRRRG